MADESTSVQFAVKWARHLLNNAAIANLGSAAGVQGSTAAGNLYVSLHTALPANGAQTTSEANYTPYARKAVARSTAGWAVVSAPLITGGITYVQATNAAHIDFAEATAFATGSSLAVSHAAVGLAATTAGMIVNAATLDAPLTVVAGMVPRIAAGTLKLRWRAIPV